MGLNNCRGSVAKVSFVVLPSYTEHPHLRPATLDGAYLWVKFRAPGKIAPTEQARDSRGPQGSESGPRVLWVLTSSRGASRTKSFFSPTMHGKVITSVAQESKEIKRRKFYICRNTLLSVYIPCTNRIILVCRPTSIFRFRKYSYRFRWKKKIVKRN